MIWKIIAVGKKLKIREQWMQLFSKIVKQNIETLGDFFKLGKKPKFLHTTESIQVSNAHL